MSNTQREVWGKPMQRHSLAGPLSDNGALALRVATSIHGSLGPLGVDSLFLFFIPTDFFLPSRWEKAPQGCHLQTDQGIGHT